MPAISLSFQELVLLINQNGVLEILISTLWSMLATSAINKSYLHNVQPIYKAHIC